MLTKTVSLGTALTLLLVGACKTSSGAKVAAADTSASATSFATQAAATAAMLLKKYNDYPLQTESELNNDCHPLIVPADPSVPFRGTAVLLHGFTNCPQQYNEFAAVLAKKGIQSFVPLAPGHGRAPVPLPTTNKVINGVSYSDYYGQYLPKIEQNDWRRYQAYVTDINQFIATLPGAKVVTGLSLGGQLATYAYLQAPGLYQRALLTSAFYGPAGTYAGHNESQQTDLSELQRLGGDTLYQIEAVVLNQLAANVSLVGNRPFSWGDSCPRHDAGINGQIGRRGICDFHLDNLSALIADGKDILATLSAAQQNQLPQVQYIFAEWDSAADTRLARIAVAQQQRVAGTSQVQVCTYPHIVPHSFFSRTDIMDIADPFWLNSFLQVATDYLAFGTTIPIDPSTPSQEVAYDVNSKSDTNNFLQRCLIYPLPLEQAVDQRTAAAAAAAATPTADPSAATTPASDPPAAADPAATAAP